ncbi:UNKNOWN [Stylonychia lemnae]|uniref:Major facilitator superfamily (MFS) profile domain-containing protein n=1 Tax=Stylonychia lemnae TaxID=5949 RepID=A0A078BAY7_STYLE|nr:UNKNOWN [Stylonychia lemnae]|eukprot:CDW90392.1 UNKNOWN [Stylonychia lemnae]
MKLENSRLTIEQEQNESIQRFSDDTEILKTGLTLQQAYERIGGFTFFHYWSSALFIWGFATGGILFFALAILEKNPRYLCYKADGTTYECQADQTFCKDPSIKYIIDWDYESSLHNWVQSLDLTCESPAKLGLLGSIYFVGWAIAAIFLPRLSDIFGRKYVYFISMLLHAIMYLGMIISRNLNLTIVLMGFFGFFSLGRTSVGYLYMQELTPTKQQTFIGTFLQIVNGSIASLIAIYFLYVSKHWLGFQIFGCVTNFLIAISIIYLPESPKQLISKKRYEEARDSLRIIARFNRYKGQIDFKFDREVLDELQNQTRNNVLSGNEQSYYDQGFLSQSNSESRKARIMRYGQPLNDPQAEPLLSKVDIIREEQQLNGTLKDLIKIRRHMINLLIMICAWIGTSFNYYLINFQLKYIKGDFFVNVITASITDMIACFLSGILYQTLGIRVVLVSCFLISLSGGFFLLIFQNFISIIPVFILLARFGVSASFNICYLANATIFPTIFAGTAFGICNTFAKVATIISPFLAEVEAPVPMAVFCTITGVVAVLTYFLQTEPNTQKGEIKMQKNS